MKNNEVENFMYYMYNRWCLDESLYLFGKNLGEHIYDKWVDSFSCSDRTMYWYSNLDNECRRKIVERANELYNK